MLLGLLFKNDLIKKTLICSKNIVLTFTYIFIETGKKLHLRLVVNKYFSISK